MKLMIYQSMRNDWALALIDDGEPIIFGYRKKIEQVKELAAKIFTQPLRWRPRVGQKSYESDHPGVSGQEKTPTWVAYLSIPK